MTPVRPEPVEGPGGREAVSTGAHSHGVYLPMDERLVSPNPQADDVEAGGSLTNLQEGDILFIDEIHRIPRTIEEYLYTAMEDFAVDFVLDKGPFAKAIRLTLKRFTLIGATTREGLLSNPLRDRFGLRFHL